MGRGQGYQQQRRGTQYAQELAEALGWKHDGADSLIDLAGRCWCVFSATTATVELNGRSKLDGGTTILRETVKARSAFDLVEHMARLGPAYDKVLLAHQAKRKEQKRLKASAKERVNKLAAMMAVAKVEEADLQFNLTGDMIDGLTLSVAIGFDDKRAAVSMTGHADKVEAALASLGVLFGRMGT